MFHGGGVVKSAGIGIIGIGCEGKLSTLIVSDVLGSADEMI